MNKQHLHAIFQKYIDNFRYINDRDHMEYYKWEFAEKFRHFDVTSSNFTAELNALKKASWILIDNAHSLPFAALVMYANKEAETVQNMFLDLFAEDHGDLEKKKQKIEAFIAQSDALKKKYAPNNSLYVNDLRSAMQFLFFRDPDHNYMYKAVQAKAFADCIEFYDDWGTMADFKLPVFYQMCDALVEEMQRYPALIETHLSRYEASEMPLHPDKNYHILAFDIIYTSQVYGFYRDMDIRPITVQARRLREEQVKQAKVLQEELLQKEETARRLEQAEASLFRAFPDGASVCVKGMGTGAVQVSPEKEFTVRFPVSEKNYDLLFFIIKKRVIFDDTTAQAELDSYLDVLQNRKDIRQQLEDARKRFAPYREYLD